MRGRETITKNIKGDSSLLKFIRKKNEGTSSNSPSNQNRIISKTISY